MHQPIRLGKPSAVTPRRPAHGTIDGKMRRYVARSIGYPGGANVSASRISLGLPGLILVPPELTEAPGYCQAAECD
jgi:hypothetical protein